jgi:aspartyl-tRNA(Asn)/glutamyl-tRNA(Gln) amidotransferase subunit A
MIQNIIDLSRKLNRGKLTSVELVKECYSRIDAAGDEGKRVFLKTYRDRAIAEAEWIDDARAKGISLPRHAGIPIAIKDLFDVAGEVTRAGSRVLDDQAPATQDAAIVTHLRRAGFVIVGKNNMTEFAYSGLGVNAHFGTPANPHDHKDQRVPGGSSSGAGVSVSTGMVPAAIGTDTGGSCRIPAAFCGVVGFKPTSNRVPKTGAVPLSRTLDCVGPFTTSVSSAAVLDSILSGGLGEDVDSHPEGGLRLGVLEGYVTEHLDDIVAKTYQETLTRLSQRGVRLVPLTIPQLAQLPQINSKGGYVGAEAYAWHKSFLESRGEFYDPWVRARFSAGKSQSAQEYIDLADHRAGLRAVVAEKQAVFDALILPSVQIVPPKLSDLEDIERSNATNLLCLRNTAVGNFLDLPAISIPCHGQGDLPVGAMLMGQSGGDRHLLSIARGLEQVIRGR